MRRNEKSCVCNVFATPHSKNPVKSSVPSYQNVNFSSARDNLLFKPYQNGSKGPGNQRLSVIRKYIFQFGGRAPFKGYAVFSCLLALSLILVLYREPKSVQIPLKVQNLRCHFSADKSDFPRILYHPNQRKYNRMAQKSFHYAVCLGNTRV